MAKKKKKGTQKGKGEEDSWLCSVFRGKKILRQGRLHIQLARLGVFVPFSLTPHNPTVLFQKDEKKMCGG